MMLSNVKKVSTLQVIRERSSIRSHTGRIVVQNRADKTCCLGPPPQSLLFFTVALCTLCKFVDYRNGVYDIWRAV
jgi:hypothetical protein